MSDEQPTVATTEKDPWPLTRDEDAAWAKVKSLVTAFNNLAEGGEPKMAATALGKAHSAAVTWSKMADPRGED